MRWEYEVHAAERRAQRVRQNRLLFLCIVLGCVLLAAMPEVPGL